MDEDILPGTDRMTVRLHWAEKLAVRAQRSRRRARSGFLYADPHSKTYRPEPEAHLRDVLTRLGVHPINRLASYKCSRQLSEWNLPPLMSRAVGAHAN